MRVNRIKQKAKIVNNNKLKVKLFQLIIPGKVKQERIIAN